MVRKLGAPRRDRDGAGIARTAANRVGEDAAPERAALAAHRDVAPTCHADATRVAGAEGRGLDRPAALEQHAVAFDRDVAAMARRKRVPANHAAAAHDDLGRTYADIAGVAVAKR